MAKEEEDEEGEKTEKKKRTHTHHTRRRGLLYNPTIREAGETLKKKRKSAFHAGNAALFMRGVRRRVVV